MTEVYRILRRPYARTAFDGEGAYRYGGRWSSSGTRLSYASAHQSLALLEYFVHLDQDDPPQDLLLAIAAFPGGISQEQVTSGELPANWRDSAAPPELVLLGDDFVKRGKNCLLWVPSVIAPTENNCLINPAHPDFGNILIRPVEPFTYDPRMFRKTRGRHKAT
ncbi:MAG: RES family NAD+ phosphorylase [Terriglobales bacterium]